VGSIEFRPRDLKVLSLLENTATLKALASELPGARLDINLAHLDLGAVFNEHKNGVLVVLGHYEDGTFIARDAAGKLIVSVQASALET
jgi:hypothetical protein